MAKNKKIMDQQVYGDMIDALLELWPEGDREHTRAVFLNRLAEYYGEAWKDKAHCLNCGALMYQYTYVMNATAARSLRKYADIVIEAMRSGKPFTEANKIYISGATNLTATETDQKTILRYHGLIAKYKENGTHIDSLWVITTWGWAFLSGKAMPKSVTVWRKRIVERSQELTNMRIALQSYAGDYDPEYYSMAIHDGKVVNPSI